jgi:hypothetical protein
LLNTITFWLVLLDALHQPDAAAALQEQVDDHHVPDLRVLLEPMQALVLGGAGSHHPHASQLLQRTDQVFADGCVVLDDIGFELLHGGSCCSRLARYPSR